MLYGLLLAAEQAADGPSPLVTFLPMILIIAALYLMVLRPAQKRERLQRESLLASMKKNDKVLTSGGIIGVIALINDKEDEVVLKVDESSNVRLRVLKSSIVRNYTQEDTAAREKEQAAQTKNEAVATKS